MRLAGKTAIVTGGAGIVRCFIDDSAQVMLADIQIEAAGKPAEQPGHATFAQAVVISLQGSVALMVKEAKKRFDDIHIPLNNAIGHAPQALEDVSARQCDDLCAVNARSVYLSARPLLALMRPTCLVARP